LSVDEVDRGAGEAGLRGVRRRKIIDSVRARGAFFSFHYDQDAGRAAVVRRRSLAAVGVRDHWVDPSRWQQAKAQGRGAVEALIEDALDSTSVTAVLIGSATASRAWIGHEVARSLARGNALVGIYIHNIVDAAGKRDRRGANPLPGKCETYDWVLDGGERHLDGWLDAACANSRQLI
jgi:hypothetical protein